MIPRPVLLLAAAGLALAGAKADPATPDNSWETGHLSFVPKAFQKDPRLDIIIVTEYTRDGKGRPRPTAAHPLYYMGDLGVMTEAGDPEAGLESLTQQRMAIILKRALTESHFQPISPGHAPDVYVHTWWGSFNRRSDADLGTDSHSLPNRSDFHLPHDPEQFRNLMERAIMVGGTQFAADLYDALNQPKLPPVVAHLAWNAFLMKSPHNEFLVSEVYSDRYFVIVGGYDAGAMLQGRRVLLWRTIISTDARGVNLRDSLPGMLAVAGRYIDRPIKTAVRLNRPVYKEGQVDLGTPVPVEP